VAARRAKKRVATNPEVGAGLPRDVHSAVFLESAWSVPTRLAGVVPIARVGMAFCFEGSQSFNE